MDTSDGGTVGAPVDVPPPQKMPVGILFILGNEFAERFCYYGINAVIMVYMTQSLHFGDAQASRWQSLFKGSAYFFPLVGAIVADVFWGKYLTIITFSMVYVLGCAILALGPTTALTLGVGLAFVAFGAGGIKPCVSTNVGDQFTSKNQHLVERAFSFFYWSVNAGSAISIPLCPVLLDRYGPRPAFGIPAVTMVLATVVFYMGRHRFAVVPPAGRQWLRDIISREGLKLVGKMGVLLLFIAGFWALWDQSNGQTWTLQATSDLMDKRLWPAFTLLSWHLPGFTLLPAQIQVANGVLKTFMVPIFTFGVYPLWARFMRVTPLRKISVGMFLVAFSFLIISGIENRIQHGLGVSMWRQILAYVVLSASEVLVSITALEYFYTQAPLRMKSFIMALYLLAISFGNFMTATVNSVMVRDLPGATVAVGSETWVDLPVGTAVVTGQKIDFDHTGLTVHRPDGKTAPLAGTFLVAEVQGNRVRLMDSIHRHSVATSGQWQGAAASVSTYRLVGPEYFNFFAYAMFGYAVVFIGVARLIPEKTFVRVDKPASA